MPAPFRDSPLTRWFDARFGGPTPVQAAAWPHVVAGHHTLIVSPTGTGKTLAAFFAVLQHLVLEHQAGALPDSIQALYVSPLRALGYDLEKNLNGPLRDVFGGTPPVRVGLRSGDTPASERQRQLTRPPHLLLTTPESLCLLLSQARWLPALATVRWVIVDEIHALAENKRGAHLSLSLERLEDLVRARPSTTGQPPAAPQRIGLSATVAPLAGAAAFLGGEGREVAVVDVRGAKRLEIAVHTPLRRDPYPPAGFTGVRLMRDLARLVREHRTTLVFTNTRSGAESATYWLKAALPAIEHQVECHHASLDRDVRQAVEDRLKRGELRAVVCSTSLELGIDIGSVDLVVMLASPKGVTRALQRTGRSGHDIRSVSRGLLMATNLNDLVECCATARLARAGHLDTLRLPQAPLDVLAQHLVSMGCTARWSRDAALALIRRSRIYRDLAASDFNAVLDYLAGGGESLRQAYTELFGKIRLDPAHFETRDGITRRDFLQNVGVIPNEGVARVVRRGRTLGTVEESFARQLQPGDVFMLGGEALRVERHGLLEVFVQPAGGQPPTVPRWNANKMPLSNRVCDEIIRFRSEVRARIEGGEAPDALARWIARRLDCGAANARIIRDVHAAQHAVSEIPTGDFLLVEDCLESELPPTVVPGSEPGSEPAPPAPVPPAGRGRARGRRGPGPLAAPPSPPATRHLFFHALVGRAANDALARVVALRLSRRRGGNAIATPDDYGFVLSVRPDQALTADDLPGLLDPAGFAGDLETALERSELLKYHFRNAAQTGLMVYRNHFGAEKPVRKLQFSIEVIFNVLTRHEPGHVLLREARRDAVHSFLDAAAATDFLARAAQRPVRLRRLTRVSPLAFAMYATRIKEALRVEDPVETLEHLYHHWWRQLQEPHA